MLGGVAELDATNQGTGLGRLERLLERPLGVSIEIVANQDDFYRLLVSRPQQGFHLDCPIDFGPLWTNRHLSPSSQWLGEHEHAGRSAAFVLVINSPRMMTSCGNRRSRSL